MFYPKYETVQLRGTNDEKWKLLKGFFPEGADKMNLLMGSTSGIHGTYTTLDQLADPEYSSDPEFTREHPEAFTFLIIQPRIVRLTYGTIGIRNDADDLWLRERITESVHIFAETQEGNTL